MCSRPIGRNGTLVRALSLLRLLEQRGHHTLMDLAARFAVHPRTVRRDLDALEAAGYPIGHDERYDTTHGRADRGTWWLSGTEKH